ncbi:class I SAM-dependent methyltransferase [Rosistilla ulvae]|uniref:class I SAM-dependent methyltransferase n=1 Tax=Rosistilla ulvae TaxID=1930277 RepID=UPI001C54C970|nr:class I SAM-dependent methyltransferase [Rosistilla ulvae]
MQIERVGCYNCGSVRNTPYDTENGFQLVKCSSCGLVYLSPRPSQSEITAATKTGQHRGDDLIDTTGMFSDAAIPRYLDILKDFFPKRMEQTASWLDIGCGHGEFITSIERYFGGKVSAKGCEPNKSKIASANRHGLDVTYFDLSSHDREYDIVSALNVFSHLPDPIETLRDWGQLIRPGGLLFLETGHSSHLKPVDHHKPYYVPDHLSFANRGIVESILAKIGFRVCKTKIYRHSVFLPLSWKATLREGGKLVLRRPNRFREMFPKQPKRDMFILARRENF